MKRLILASILALFGYQVQAQTVTYPNYLQGLPSLGSVLGTEQLYTLQGSTSNKVTSHALIDGTMALNGFFFPQGAAGNGTTDDTAKIAAALTACSTAGGGKVVLSQRYLIDSASITVPAGCELFCPSPVRVTVNSGLTPVDFTTRKSTIVLNSARTINMASSSGMSGCTILQKAIASTVPTTLRANLAYAAAYAGNAISLGIPTAPIGSGADVTIHDVFIGGFNWAILSQGDAIGGTYTPNTAAANTARLHLDHVKIDSRNCIWLSRAFDIPSMIAIECHPFLTTVQPNHNSTWTVGGIADNGAGLYRVTCTTTCAETGTATTNLLRTGDVVVINGSTMVGPESVRSNRWTITVINGTQFDLQGSSSAAKVITGGVITGKSFANNLSSGTNIGGRNSDGTDLGPTITDSAGRLPGGTTVLAVNTAGDALILSAAATGTTASDTLTITDTAWASGGTIGIDANRRYGTAFYLTYADFVPCLYCFAFGYDITFRFGTGANNFDCSPCYADNSGINDPSTIAIQIGGGTPVRFQGGYMVQHGQVYRGDGANGGQLNTLVNVNAAVTSNTVFTLFEMHESRYGLIGVSSAGGTHYGYIGPGVDDYQTAANSISGITVVDAR